MINLTELLLLLNIREDNFELIFGNYKISNDSELIILNSYYNVKSADARILVTDDESVGITYYNLDYIKSLINEYKDSKNVFIGNNIKKLVKVS